MCHTSATHAETAARVLEAAWENSFKTCNAPQREDRFRQRVTADGAEARRNRRALHVDNVLLWPYRLAR